MIKWYKKTLPLGWFDKVVIIAGREDPATLKCYQQNKTFIKFAP
ncbi:hypothetical protein BN439_0951 [Erwinia amylovora Ea644]|nr:hypothetical protein BN439_0951 [Erwinia amylovora Ea644]CCP06069.1 hypothetical protein BN440_1019 [Erwinia amylovora MR1]